jgi:hypothetical protein
VKNEGIGAEFEHGEKKLCSISPVYVEINFFWPLYLYIKYDKNENAYLMFYHISIDSFVFDCENLKITSTLRHQKYHEYGMQIPLQ